MWRAALGWALRDDVAIAMELVLGGSVRSLLTGRSRRCTLPTLLGLLAPAASAPGARARHGANPASCCAPRTPAAHWPTSVAPGATVGGRTAIFSPERWLAPAHPSQDVTPPDSCSALAGPAPLLTLRDSMTRPEPGTWPTAAAPAGIRRCQPGSRSGVGQAPRPGLRCADEERSVVGDVRVSRTRRRCPAPGASPLGVVRSCIVMSFPNSGTSRGSAGPGRGRRGMAAAARSTTSLRRRGASPAYPRCPRVVGRKEPRLGCSRRKARQSCSADDIAFEAASRPWRWSRQNREQNHQLTYSSAMQVDDMPSAAATGEVRHACRRPADECRREPCCLAGDQACRAGRRSRLITSIARLLRQYLPGAARPAVRRPLAHSRAFGATRQLIGWSRACCPGAGHGG